METTGGTATPSGSAIGSVRIEATAAHRRAASAGQWLLVGLIALLAAVGMRMVAHFWPVRGDPEIRRALWSVIGVFALAGLTLAWLIVLVQDLVKMRIEIDEEGVRVQRVVRPFRARWDEIREIGVAPVPGHVTLVSARGTLTVTRGLLGAAPFAALMAALQTRAGAVVREWGLWAATRRQLVVLAVPALGLGFLLLMGQGLWRRRRAPGGWVR